MSTESACLSIDSQGRDVTLSELESGREKAKTHHNNFNLMRLGLAWLVIVSHSYELIDGDRSREPLTTLFGTLSAGGLAVNAFFVLSGLLVCQSWRKDPVVLRYLSRRLARIVPAFGVCVATGAVVYAVVYDSSYWQAFDWPRFLGKLTVLQAGGLPAAFPGTHYPVLNQSLWTIHYEFLCYLGLLVLGCSGLLNNRVVIPLWGFGTLVWLAYPFLSDCLLEIEAISAYWRPIEYYFGNCVRFACCYLTGIAWALNKTKVDGMPSTIVAILVVAFGLFLGWPPLHLLASSVLLVPVLLVLGLWLPAIPGFWQRHDISYGVYLYAWPVQKMLFSSVEIAKAPYGMIALATGLTIGVAWFSWLCVERPVIRRLQARLASTARIVSSV